MSLTSPFTNRVDQALPLPEYPRPQLVRSNWLNLNGIWEYQINQGNHPAHDSGWKTICVPFVPGSLLSGTQEILQPGKTIWYRRQFEYHPAKPNHQVLMNFEAVDQVCSIFVNGLPAGGHEGGYTPFSVDITNLVKVKNEVLIKVSDESDQGKFVYGKQKMEHGGMWYTPSSGIWQTVWIEELPEHSVQDVKITPDLDGGKVYFQMAGGFKQTVITVYAEGVEIHRGMSNDSSYILDLPDARVWSLEDPFLYDVKIQTEDDTVLTYFGMRKFSRGKDARGVERFQLNNRPLFLTGVLDQGYSVDGILTYPCEDAMKYDILRMKSLGFNFLRKHVKIENRRWYHLCDRYGMLVMQDMPNGGFYSYVKHTVLPTFGITAHFHDHAYEKNGRENAEGRAMFVEELDAMLDMLYNSVSIFSWVPFNEGWGQFDTKEITQRIQDYDVTRLIDSASGWFDKGCGDFQSIHTYFKAFKVPKLDGRALLLSEFGGYTYVAEGHSAPSKVYGYKKFKDRDAFNDAILTLYEKDILAHIREGLSGCVLTQLSDVEDECNGLLSADRRLLKVDEKKLTRINERCVRNVR